jgi:VWFA-related protein
MSSPARLLLSSLFAFLFVFPLAAQYSERVDVAIANIDVVVRDADGNLVRGLTRDDFEVYENGKLQKVTNFSAIEGSVRKGDRGEAPATASEPLRREPRLFVLFVDIGDIEPGRRMEFFRDVHQFASTAMEKGDFATVLVWSRRIRIALPPTSSREALISTIDALGDQRFGTLADTMQSEQVADAYAAMAAGDEGFIREAGMSLLKEADDEDEKESFEAFFSSEERCARLRRKVREVRSILGNLSQVEMKKIVLFASDDLNLKPARSCDLATDLSKLADAANAYGVTIHGLHPPGTRTKFIGPERSRPPGTRESTTMSNQYARTHEEAGGLALLAQRTGGVAGVGRDSERLLKQVAEELESYYSIGYSMSPGAEDKARGVKVVVKNRKYQVRTRQAVVRVSEATRLQNDVTSSLYFERQESSQSPSFTASITGVRRDGRYRRVSVELSIRASDLLVTGSETRKRGSFSVFVAAGSQLGDASDVTELQQEFDAASIEAAKPLTYAFETRIRPDTKRLSIAVRDNATGEVAKTVLELPRTSSANHTDAARD